MRVFALKNEGSKDGEFLYLGSVDAQTTTEYGTILTELNYHLKYFPELNGKLTVLTFVPEEVTPVLETLYKLTR